MVRTELTVPNARLLGLDSKLYPSNVPRMFNKDLTQLDSYRVFLEYVKVEEEKEKFC